MKVHRASGPSANHIIRQDEDTAKHLLAAIRMEAKRVTNNGLMTLVA